MVVTSRNTNALYGSHRNLSSISFGGETVRRNYWMGQSSTGSGSNNNSESSTSLSTSDDDDYFGGYRSADDADVSSFHRRRKRSGTWP